MATRYQRERQAGEWGERVVRLVKDWVPLCDRLGNARRSSELAEYAYRSSRRAARYGLIALAMPMDSIKKRAGAALTSLTDDEIEALMVIRRFVGPEPERMRGILKFLRTLVENGSVSAQEPAVELGAQRKETNSQIAPVRRDAQEKDHERLATN